jgi:deoxyadenosine/deoxycytidine kinase
MTIVCIDGIIGCGKTTLIRSLKDKYNCFEEPIDKWTLLGSLYNDMNRFAEPFQFQVLFTQYEQLCTFRNIDKVVVERCPETSLCVFTEVLKDYGYFDDGTWKVYKGFYDTMGYKPDYYIYLDVNINSAWDRIKNRDRFEEQNITLDYLQDLKLKYDLFFEGKDNVFKVDAHKPSIQVKYDVDNIIQGILYKKDLN